MLLSVPSRQDAKMLVSPIRYLYHKFTDSSHIKALPTIATTDKDLISNYVIYFIHSNSDIPRSFEFLVKNLVIGLQLPRGVTIRVPAFFNRYQGETIDGYALQLLNIIRSNHDINRSIILVGHSRGGLVAAWLTENLAKLANINVRMVITICSPFKGAKIAAQIPAPFNFKNSAMTQMRSTSSFLEGLRQQVLNTMASGLVRYEYFAAINNQLVSVESAHVYPMWSYNNISNFRILPGEHSSILKTYILVDIISTIIQEFYADEHNSKYSGSYATLNSTLG